MLDTIKNVVVSLINVLSNVSVDFFGGVDLWSVALCFFVLGTIAKIFFGSDNNAK